MNVCFSCDTMYKSVDLNSVADHIKNIFDGSRCVVCDKHDGKRVRYVCGHTSCEDCAQFGNCSLCLTPPGSKSSKPVLDKPLTERADNARHLLDSFQECFNYDVAKRQRLSEQLKVEKELFPQCIQAPAKYHNKRKSYLSLKQNKENSFILPGQEISGKVSKMENSGKNVQDWLNKYIKRKPFSELDPNQTLRRNEKQKTHSNSKFTELKTKDYSRTSKKRKSESNTIFGTTKILKTNNVNTVNDESGIVLDDDDDKEAVIVIDDSQDIVDKDREALLAVVQAENNKISSESIGTTFFDSSQDESGININDKKTVHIHEKDINQKEDLIINDKNEFSTKIPFYKKGYLTELCKYCNEVTNTHSKSHKDVDKNICITVDSKSFTTVIRVSQNDNYLTKQSIQVQTDTTESNIINTPQNIDNKKRTIAGLATPTNKKIEEQILAPTFKQDLLEGEKEDVKLLNISKNIIIEESDTDSDNVDASISLEVTAEVHRSCDQMDYKILENVKNIEEHSKRPRRPARGNTPNSTDSSDKENYNPNRMRKTHNTKKKYKK